MTHESSWELPFDMNDESTNMNDEFTTNTISERQLPENWIQQPTEDGNTYYYYNVVTKDIRWTHPGDGDGIDMHVASTLPEEENELGNFETDKASIASSKDSQLSSNETVQQKSQHRRSIE